MERAWRPLRVLEIVLVIGSFVAASVLGWTAVRSDPRSGAARADQPAGQDASGEPDRLADDLVRCLRDQPGVVSVSPQFPPPPRGQVLLAQLEDGGDVLLFVFREESDAAAYEDEALAEARPSQLVVLGRVAVAYSEFPSTDVKNAVEGCVLS